MRADLLTTQLLFSLRSFIIHNEYKGIEWHGGPVLSLDLMAKAARDIECALVEMGANPHIKRQQKPLSEEDEGEFVYHQTNSSASEDEEEEDEGKMVDDEAEEASEDEPDPTSEEEDSSDEGDAKARRKDLEPVMECVASLGYVLSRLEFSSTAEIPSRFMPMSLMARLEGALKSAGGEVRGVSAPTFCWEYEGSGHKSKIRSTPWRVRELRPVMKIVSYLGYMLNHLQYNVTLKRWPSCFMPLRLFSRLKLLLRYAGGKVLDNTEPTFGRGNADSSEEDQGSSDEEESDEEPTARKKPTVTKSNKDSDDEESEEEPTARKKPVASSSKPTKQPDDESQDGKEGSKTVTEKLAPAMKTVSYLIYMLRWLSYKNSDMDREYDPFNLVLQLEEELQQAGGRCVVARKPPFTRFVNWPYVDTSDDESDKEYEPTARKKPTAAIASKKATADKDSDSEESDEKDSSDDGTRARVGPGPCTARTYHKLKLIPMRKSKKPHSAAASASKPASKKARKA